MDFFLIVDILKFSFLFLEKNNSFEIIEKVFL